MNYIAVKSHILNRDIIPSETFFKMLYTDDMKKALGYLAKTPYYDLILQNIKFPEKIRDVIECVFLERILRYVSWTQTLRSSFIREYIKKYAIKFLIAVLKAKFYGKRQPLNTKQKEILAKLLPKIDIDRVYEMEMVDLLSMLKRNRLLHGNINEIIELSKESANFLPIELEIWKTYYGQIIHHSDFYKSVMLRKYIGMEIDIQNLYGAILLRKIGLNEKVASKFFIYGGYVITKEVFLKILRLNKIETVKDLIPGTYRQLVMYYLKGDTHKLSYEENRLLFNIISKAKSKEPTGIEYSLYVIRRLELEKYNLQLVISAFLFELNREAIEAMIFRY